MGSCLLPQKWDFLLRTPITLEIRIKLRSFIETFWVYRTPQLKEILIPNLWGSIDICMEWQNGEMAQCMVLRVRVNVRYACVQLLRA